MFRFLIFVLIAAGFIYFFGERLYKWVCSMAKAANRKENQKWKAFDTKLNPPKPETKPKKRASK